MLDNPYVWFLDYKKVIMIILGLSQHFLMGPVCHRRDLADEFTICPPSSQLGCCSLTPGGRMGNPIIELEELGSTLWDLLIHIFVNIGSGNGLVYVCLASSHLLNQCWPTKIPESMLTCQLGFKEQTSGNLTHFGLVSHICIVKKTFLFSPYKHHKAFTFLTTQGDTQ